MFPIEIINRRAAANWLILAVSSLAVGGIFSILLVLARTPQFQELIPWRDFFRTALIIHVNESVLIWFLACAILLWTVFSNRKFDMTAKAGFWCFAAGTGLMGISPLLGAGDPLTNNYIPVLQHVLFFLSLSLLATGLILTLAWKLPDFTKPQASNPLSVIQFGTFVAAATSATAIVCFVISYKQLPIITDHTHYYELLFWGGGHILQFTHTQAMLIAWIILFATAFPDATINWKYITAAFMLNLIVVIPMPLTYAFYDASSPEHYQAFSNHMKHIGGLASIIVFISLLYSFFKSKKSGLSTSPALAYLFCSIVLFGAGGIIGNMISGYNVTIPAHYHGSIVGVSIAFMGVATLLLPKLGFTKISRKSGIIQPTLYAVGQLMHISGLAWSGGYGALRKSAETVIDPNVKIAMGLMGAGGLIAIIGGLMFVVMMYKAMRETTNPQVS